MTGTNEYESRAYRNFAETIRAWRFLYQASGQVVSQLVSGMPHRYGTVATRTVTASRLPAKGYGLLPASDSGADIEQAESALPQRFGIIGCKRQYQPAGRRSGFEDDVTIGPSEPKRVHSRSGRLLRARPTFELRLHFYMQLLERNMRVRFIEMEIRRNRSVMKGQRHLHQTGHSGCRLEMAHIRFGGSDA
jgi:hypothetical protein